MSRTIETQNLEFDRLQILCESFKALRSVAVVDDDYPGVRRVYEGELKIFLEAVNINRRNVTIVGGIPQEVIEVINEIERAREKHPTMPSHHHAASVLREEYEEYWEHVKDDTYFSTEARKELVQIAASAIRAMIDIPQN